MISVWQELFRRKVSDRIGDEQQGLRRTMTHFKNFLYNSEDALMQPTCEKKGKMHVRLNQGFGTQEKIFWKCENLK